MSSFALPDLGEGLQEAEIVSWHVADGDHVVADQPLVSVETEKAVVEIPSPRAGHIARLLARVGERVKVGAPVLEFEDGPHVGSVTVVGQLTEPPPTGVAIPAPHASAPPAAAAVGVRASPAVRNRARELAVDLATVTAKGPGGAVTLADVQAAAARSSQNGNSLRGARRTMAVNMARAWQEVVHATLQDEADIGAWSGDEDVTVRAVRGLIAGCKDEASINSSYDAATFTVRDNETIDVGIAIDGPDGLFVPVLRDVVRGTPQDWRRQIDEFERGVRERSLTPGQLRGPTISLSNFGAIAGRHASLIIMPPQVAIVGVGRTVMRPVQTSEGIALRRALPLSLTFDHRSITGGMAARFLRAVIADLEAAT